MKREELKQYLKENLSLDCEWSDCGCCNTVKIMLKLEDEKISSVIIHLD